MATHHGKSHGPHADASGPDRVPRKVYDRELLRLQAELVKLQEWV